MSILIPDECGLLAAITHHADEYLKREYNINSRPVALFLENRYITEIDVFWRERIPPELGTAKALGEAYGELTHDFSDPDCLHCDKKHQQPKDCMWAHEECCYKMKHEGAGE